MGILDVIKKKSNNITKMFNNNHCLLLSTYHMSGTMLSVFNCMFHFASDFLLKLIWKDVLLWEYSFWSFYRAFQCQSCVFGNPKPRLSRRLKKTRKRILPQSLQKELRPVNTLIFIQWYPCRTSDLQDDKKINLCSFKTLGLW